MKFVGDMVFSPSFGNRPTRLVGREEVLQQITQGFATRPGSKERATVLLGQRGYGKTVLLWELAERARAAGFVVANPVAVREGMVSRVYEKLQDDAENQLGHPARRLAGANVGALGFSAGLTLSQNDSTPRSPESNLEHLVRTLSNRGWGTLLLVDELQANSPEVRSLVDTYQELVGEGLNVAIVLAGLPGAVSGVLNDHVLTFLNRARKITLSELPVGEIDAFYKSAFAECGITISADLRHAAAKAAQGSPYYMQLIGHYTVLYAGADGLVVQSFLTEALAAAAEEFQADVCETTLAALSAGDVAYLRAMAHVAQNGQAATAQVAQALGVGADYGQQYRKRLISAGVIRATQRGYVEFAVPNLETYLQNQE